MRRPIYYGILAGLFIGMALSIAGRRPPRHVARTIRWGDLTVHPAARPIPSTQPVSATWFIRRVSDPSAPLTLRVYDIRQLVLRIEADNAREVPVGRGLTLQSVSARLDPIPTLLFRGFLRHTTASPWFWRSGCTWPRASISRCAISSA